MKHACYCMSVSACSSTMLNMLCKNSALIIWSFQACLFFHHDLYHYDTDHSAMVWMRPSLWHPLQILMDHLSSSNCIFLLLRDQVKHSYCNMRVSWINVTVFCGGLLEILYCVTWIRDIYMSLTCSLNGANHGLNFLRFQFGLFQNNGKFQSFPTPMILGTPKSNCALFKSSKSIWLAAVNFATSMMVSS